MKSEDLRFLRPYLSKDYRQIYEHGKRHYARFYAASAAMVQMAPECDAHQLDREPPSRRRGLQHAGETVYPRIARDSRAMTCEAFRQRYQHLKNEENSDDAVVTVRGRVHSLRTAGSRLVFVDVIQNRQRVQGLCNLGRMAKSGVDLDRFTNFNHMVQRGDIISLTGIPHRTGRGELSVNVTELPQLLAPSLQPLPTELLDPETRMRNRHEDLLVNQQIVDTLHLRSYIIQYLRDFLLSDDFLEVNTPIMASGTGGAIARPFKTTATEFMDRKIELRVAPELWLKRLVLGGMDRVFEIGPCFRNEGIDLTHNPEFTTCEFYKSFADLEELMAMTERLLHGLAVQVEKLKMTQLKSLPSLDTSFNLSFGRIDFIPFVEAAIKRPLPDLSLPDATSNLLQTFQDLSILAPPVPTLPRLLDKLSSIYIEPHCTGPTFVMNHPECLSPLSKSFVHPTIRQRVSARIELFVHGSELVNAYEEENSPFEQRRKFTEQLAYRDEQNRTAVDESYLDALEWGLPPTGGWGCGLDRLVMLFSGAKRIGDVLSFGTLRNVVGLDHSVAKRTEESKGTVDT